MKLGEIIETKQGGPVLELIIKDGDDKEKKVYLMSDKGGGLQIVDDIGGKRLGFGSSIGLGSLVLQALNKQEAPFNPKVAKKMAADKLLNDTSDLNYSDWFAIEMISVMAQAAMFDFYTLNRESNDVSEDEKFTIPMRDNWKLQDFSKAVFIWAKKTLTTLGIIDDLA